MGIKPKQVQQHNTGGVIGPRLKKYGRINKKIPAYTRKPLTNVEYSAIMVV